MIPILQLDIETEAIENQNPDFLELSLIKIYRGYLLSEMAENDVLLERAELFDDFLRIQDMIRQCQN